jgi:hypothetical protein
MIDNSARAWALLRVLLLVNGSISISRWFLTLIWTSMSWKMVMAMLILYVLKFVVRVVVVVLADTTSTTTSLIVCVSINQYVKHNGYPSFFDFDYLNGTINPLSTLHLDTPAAGIWTIGVYGYRGDHFVITATVSQAGTQYLFFHHAVSVISFAAAADDDDDDLMVIASCIGQCSGPSHGSCTGHSCSCNSAYTGDACEHSMSNSTLSQCRIVTLVSDHWIAHFCAFSHQSVTTWSWTLSSLALSRLAIGTTTNSKSSRPTTSSSTLCKPIATWTVMCLSNLPRIQRVPRISLPI